MHSVTKSRVRNVIFLAFVGWRWYFLRFDIVRFCHIHEGDRVMAAKPPGRLSKSKKTIRKDHEPPMVISKKGWRYHHLGIPTRERKPGEFLIESAGLVVSGFSSSPYGIEWMRFEKGSPISALIQKVPHIAFEVDDLDKAMEGLTLLGPVTSPSRGVRVAMIVDNGAPVELIEFARNRKRRP